MLIIYIPTYRRPSSLKKQLHLLSLEFGALPDQTSSARVVVSINGKDDNKDIIEWIEPISQANSWLSFIVRPYNIGGNANIALGFIEGGPDDYVWLLSDNDIISLGTLTRIIDAIEPSHPPDILILSSGAHDNLSQVVYNDIADWTQCPLISLGLISRGVYSLKFIGTSLESAFLYISSSFPHLALILSSLRISRKCTVLELGHCTFMDPHCSTSDYIGKYDLSYAGRAQLVSLLPRKSRLSYASCLLKHGSVDLLRSFQSYRHVAISSIAVLFAYAPSLVSIIPFYLLYDVYRRVSKKLYLHLISNTANSIWKR